MDLAETQVDVIRLGALLHDIGKIGVADEILRKPGPLTAQEFEQIKRHPALGARILQQVPFLAAHLPIVELHHERPDGHGYPFGLRADEIPVDARIVHVADAFDAMTSARAYRPGRPASAALVRTATPCRTRSSIATSSTRCTRPCPRRRRSPSSSSRSSSDAVPKTPRPVSSIDGRRARTLALALALLFAAGRASAQETRPSILALDTEAAVDVAVDKNGNDATNLFFDAVASARLGRNVEAIVRPFAQRLAATGEWNRQIWVAAVRYERQGPIGVRIDGGLIPSPVGYANMLLRPHLNPTIAQPSSLFTPLPAVEARGPRATLLGAIYPYGVNATVSSQWWDARVAIIDTSPLRTRRIFAEANPPRFTNVVFGGGITPVGGPAHRHVDHVRRLAQGRRSAHDHAQRGCDCRERSSRSTR